MYAFVIWSELNVHTLGRILSADGQYDTGVDGEVLHSPDTTYTKKRRKSNAHTESPTVPFGSFTAAVQANLQSNTEKDYLFFLAQNGNEDQKSKAMEVIMQRAGLFCSNSSFSTPSHQSGDKSNVSSSSQQTSSA
jgi:hypothetical protein